MKTNVYAFDNSQKVSHKILVTLTADFKIDEFKFIPSVIVSNKTKETLKDIESKIYTYHIFNSDS